MAITGAPNFTFDEFERKSDVPLTDGMRAHARWHAQRLQAARNALNSTWASPDVGGEWRIHVTSFIRSGDVGRDHEKGGAVDWNVRDRSGARNDGLTRWARDWLATSEHRDGFAELLFEPAFEEDGNSFAHVHHTRRGFSPDDDPDEPTEVLDLTESGDFVEAAIDLIPAPAFPIAAAFAIVALLFLGESVLRRA